MRFWDSSAVVPLLVAEATSATVQGEFDRDPAVIVWWATDVECTSAIARLEREGALGPAGSVEALQRLSVVLAAADEVQPSDRVRQLAIRLLRVHDLRAADALQLAAALAAAEGEPASLAFVTLDDRLARAAEREGFQVIEPRSP